jgi:CheY-like chemotaxis protein
MKHILVVEDEPLNAILFRKVLERRAGCRVTLTEDVALIMDLVRGGSVDLVILDVSLANSRWEGRPMNGVDVCRLLKAEPESARVPVLLATAHAMRGDAESLLAASGADGYVAKPIVDHGVFVDQVRRLLAEAA